MTKNDIKLIGIILLFVIGILCMSYFFMQEDGAFAIIYIDGVQEGSYTLDKEQSIVIGDSNQAEIKEHSVFMIAANCPDKLCVKQRAIWKKGETIICLPNKVVIEIQGNAKEQDVDVIVN